MSESKFGEFDHDGSTLLPRGLAPEVMVEVASDDGIWSDPVMAGSLEWSLNHYIPIRKWRRCTPPNSSRTGRAENNLHRVRPVASSIRLLRCPALRMTPSWR